MSDPAEKPRRYRLHPDDEVGARAALEDLAAGRTVELTAAELEQWQASGELPPSVEARFAALGCGASRD